ncbi:hypothetical protein FHR84_001097 [Actinopolyspora biskrensis]|uniref:Uncharacterized protein n=1 Tax=Actinopolyspora biskrensis TaxID=1470178 RepID=A0A852Z6F4_9ACTN|nr:hypothetical protein [Actinopolyspora biskrensis]
MRDDEVPNSTSGSSGAYPPESADVDPRTILSFTALQPLKE